jgi:hypothetical protein
VKLVRVLVLALLVVSCDGSLIAPSEPGLHFTLRDVDRQSLPVEGPTIYNFSGTIHVALLGAELLLRPDSSTLTAFAVQWDSAGTRMVRKPEWTGWYSIVRDSIRLCLNCAGGFELVHQVPYGEGELVVPFLESFWGHNYRFVRD